MKKKITVTAKAIVNNGEGWISIIITDNLPAPDICTIDHYAKVRYYEDVKRYFITFVNHCIPDYLQQHEQTINEVVWKMAKRLNRKGLKDCIIKEESITKTYGKVVDKIVVGVDPECGTGKLYVHCYLPDRKEYFELMIHKEKWSDGLKYFLTYPSMRELKKHLNEDEFRVIYNKLFHFLLDNFIISRKSFVKTIKC